MPGPAILGFYGTCISIDKKDVHKVRIFVEQDGNGAIEVPYNGTMTVLQVRVRLYACYLHLKPTV